MEISPISVPLEFDAHGVCRVAGTRVTLLTVIDSFEEGSSPEEICQEYSLSLADVYSVLAFYLERRAEVESYLDSVRNREAEVLNTILAHSEMPAIRRRLAARKPVAP
jgi:uncharacterized protein (DUF433 family)